MCENKNISTSLFYRNLRSKSAQLSMTNYKINAGSCRICIRKPGRLSVFNKTNGISIADMMTAMTAVEIDVDDNLPKLICLLCAKKMAIVYGLIQTILKSDKDFRDAFVSKENQEDDISLKVEQTQDNQDYVGSCNYKLVGISDDHEDDEVNETVAETTETSKNDMPEELQENYLNEEEVEVIEYQCDEPEEYEHYEVYISDKEKNDDLEYNNEQAGDDVHVENHQQFQKEELIVEPEGEESEEIDETAQQYECGICQELFYELDPLNNHLLLHADENHKDDDDELNISTETRIYECSICHLVFYKSDVLNTHMRTHTASRSFTCDDCGKTFKTMATLNIHMRLHSNGRPFQCDVCNQRFLTNGALTSHKITHLPDDVRQMKCHKCDKIFRNKRFLDFHLLKHEGVKNEVCAECGKTFFKRKDLLRHTNTVHLKVKNHVCSFCDKAFSNSGNLYSHMRTHTGEKPYACKYCAKRFNQATPYARHTQRHVERGHQFMDCSMVKD